MFNFLFSKQKEKKIIGKNELDQLKLYTDENLFKIYSFSFGIQIVRKDNNAYLLVATNEKYDFLTSTTDFIDHLRENLTYNFIVDNEGDILRIYFVFSNRFNQI